MKSRTLPVLLTLLLLDLVLGGAFWYGFRDVTKKNQEISEVLAQVETATQEETLISSIKHAQEGAEGELAVVESLKLREERLVPLIEEIEANGRVLGVGAKINSVEVENKSLPAGEPRKVKITLEAKGGWSSIAAFARGIENMPYHIIVTDLSLTKGEADWVLRSTLTVYSFK